MIVREALNENMRYRDFFGKEISHENALQKRIRDLIVGIIVEERGISEKSFSLYDSVIDEVKEICDRNPNIYEEAQKYYENGQRLNLLAEDIYQKYFI